MLNKKNNLILVGVQKKILKTVGVFLSVLVIFSCSISDDKPSDEGISGVIADGYLKRALVFLDCDKNFMKTGDELSLLSGEGGKYTFSDIPENQRKCQIVVDATDTNTVVDEDDGKTLAEAGRKGFKLVAPSGSKFVSPLSTVAHVVKDEDVKSVLDKLGITQEMLDELGMSGKEFLLANFMHYQDDAMLSKKSNVMYKAATTARMMAYMMSAKQFIGSKSDIPCRGKSCVTHMNGIVEVLSSVHETLTNADDFDGGVHRMGKHHMPMFDFKKVEAEMDKNFKNLNNKEKIEIDYDDSGYFSQEYVAGILFKKNDVDTTCKDDTNGGNEEQIFLGIAPPYGPALPATAIPMTAKELFNSLKANDTNLTCSEDLFLDDSKINPAIESLVSSAITNSEENTLFTLKIMENETKVTLTEATTVFKEGCDCPSEFPAKEGGAKIEGEFKTDDFSLSINTPNSKYNGNYEVFKKVVLKEEAPTTEYPTEGGEGH